LVGLPFYIFISLLLVGLSILVVLPLLRREAYGWLALFAALQGLHLTLYWLNTRWHDDPRWARLYYPVQAVLLAGLTLMPEAISIVPTLLIALCGEVLGVRGNSWLALLLILAYGLLVGGLLVWRLPGTDVLDVLSTTVINGAFILIILALFNRQLAQGERLERYAEEVERLTLEAERERMARELHDTLAQGVAGLILQLEAIKAHHTQGNNDRVEVLLTRALGRARNTLQESRAAITDLRSMAHMDFETALRETIESFKAMQNADVEVVVDLDPARTLSPSVRHHARRVLAEGLLNVHRHAKASSVRIEVDQSEDRLRIVIADDGVGFDPEQASGGDHYGLKGLQERAHLTGSRFDLESRPGAGTTLRFVFPLERGSDG
jgi:NarL family two-component system sensor histidine kinase YdfH